MAKTTKNILSLNHEEVMDFFMKSEQYHGFELKEYFTFDDCCTKAFYKNNTILLAYQDNSVNG